MRAIETSAPTEKTKRAPRPAEKPADPRPTREEEAAARATAAAERFDDIAKAISMTQDRSVSSWIAARREQILADTTASESKDVEQALHKRMELSALAAKMTPDQTLALRAYLDALDATDASHAGMMAEKRQAKKGTSSEAADARTEEWKQAKEGVAALKAEVLATGLIKLDDYRFDLKATRDAMRGERLSLRDIDPQEMAAIKLYIDAADAVERAHTQLGKTARALKKLTSEDPAYGTAVKEDDKAYRIYEKLRKQVEGKNASTYAAHPELSTKASRERLRQEISGLNRVNADLPLAMEEYDEPRFISTPSYVQNRAEAKSRAAFIADPENAQDMDAATVAEWDKADTQEMEGRTDLKATDPGVTRGKTTLPKTAVPESKPAQKTLVTRRPYRENTVTEPGVLPPLPDYGRSDEHLETAAKTETMSDGTTGKIERPTLVPLSEEEEDDIVLTDDMRTDKTDAFPENPTLVPEDATDIGQVRAAAKRVLKQESTPVKKPSGLGSFFRRTLLTFGIMMGMPSGHEAESVAREQTMLATAKAEPKRPDGQVTLLENEVRRGRVDSKLSEEDREAAIKLISKRLKPLEKLPTEKEMGRLTPKEREERVQSVFAEIEALRAMMQTSHIRETVEITKQKKRLKLAEENWKFVRDANKIG